jgi:predicted small lipoprotein YifL
VLKLQNLMKKYLVLIATLSLALGACERHPASQLPNEEGVAKEGTEKSGPPEKKSATPETSPSGTPKTYFPQNP